MNISCRYFGRLGRRFKLNAMAVALLAFCTQAGAIDLLDSYDQALQHDAITNAAKANAEAGREALPQAVAQFMPNVSFSYSKSRVQQQRTTGSLEFPKQSYPSSSQTLTIRQPIFRVNLLDQYSVATAEVENTEAMLSREIQNLAVKTSSAYFEALLAQDRLVSIQAQKELYANQLRSAEISFKAGFGMRTDIDAFRASYDRAVADEIEAKQLIDYNLQQLSTFIGVQAESLSTLNKVRFHPDHFTVGILEDWIEKAASASPEVKSLKAKVDVAEAKVKVAQTGHYPTVDLIAQYSKSQSDNIYFTGTATDTKSIGLQLNVPLFAGGSVNSMVREAAAIHEAAGHNYLDALNRISLQTRKEFNALKEGTAQIHALEQSLRSYEQLVISNQKGVLAGTRSTIDVLTAQQQKFDAEMRLAEARYHFLLAWITLNSYIGGANPELISQVNENFLKSN